MELWHHELPEDFGQPLDVTEICLTGEVNPGASFELPEPQSGGVGVRTPLCAPLLTSCSYQTGTSTPRDKIYSSTQTGIEPGSLAPESGALPTEPPRLSRRGPEPEVPGGAPRAWEPGAAAGPTGDGVARGSALQRAEGCV